MEGERRSGPPDRREDIWERLDEIDAGYKKRADQNRKLIEKFARWTAIILAVLAVAQLGLGALSVKLLVQGGHQQDKISSQQGAIARAVQAIQRQRAEAIWDGCRTQNYHHDLTIRRLDLLVQGIKNPARKLRAENNTAATVSLIDALAPAQDCKLLLAERLHLKGELLDRLTKQLAAKLGPSRPPGRH